MGIFINLENIISKARETGILVEVETNPKADKDYDIITYMCVSNTRYYLYSLEMFEEIKELAYRRLERKQERLRWKEKSRQKYDEEYYEKLNKINFQLQKIGLCDSLYKLLETDALVRVADITVK